MRVRGAKNRVDLVYKLRDIETGSRCYSTIVRDQLTGRRLSYEHTVQMISRSYILFMAWLCPWRHIRSDFFCAGPSSVEISIHIRVSNETLRS